MDSQIRVESTVGEGSRFWFSLPTHSTSEVHRSLFSTPKCGVHLLIVDDNREIGDLLGEYCSTLGMQVTCTYSPQNGLKWLNTARYHSGGFRIQ